MAESFEVVIVGAGLVGLATARALLRARPRSLVVLEAEDHVAAHQSGHNSGVLHSGLYYRPGSLKALLCRSGREAMLSFCREHAIAHELCGKLVVATRADELARLDELERRGRANGLAGLERLAAERIADFEPAARGIAALHVPEAGIVDFPAVARAMAREIEALGGLIHFSQAVRGVRRTDGGVRLSSREREYQCRRWVNCAGVRADRLALAAGLRTDIRIIPFRGEYKLVRSERTALVRNLIYPVPDPRFPFLGVHFTRRVDGTLEAGPNAVLALSRDGYRWRDWRLRDLFEFAGTRGLWSLGRKHWKTAIGEVQRSLSPGAFARALQRLVPEIEARDLVPGGAGVRAQALTPTGELLDDFALEVDAEAVHVLSAPSPAATASLVIGEEIVRRAGLALA